MHFILGKSVNFEESLTCEFKEVRGQPAHQAIGKVVDEYVVAYLNETGGSVYWGIRNQDREVMGVQLSDQSRDQLKQVVGLKVASIAPHVHAAFVEMPFHPVLNSDGDSIGDTFVVEVRVTPPGGHNLFVTGSGESYRKTMGGTKKLTGAELIAALLPQLQSKLNSGERKHNRSDGSLTFMRSVERRAHVVQPLVTGGRILWIDGNPTNNLYERIALSTFGIHVDLALTSQEAIEIASVTNPDLVISDMSRGGNDVAGIETLDAFEGRSLAAPIVFYVGKLDPTKPVPRRAFAITDRPDTLIHYIFDLLERREPNR